ncbi:unnamed protein product [Acanthosepion pharaonis]|uniref:Uncharacterized protein n=1 Tax=Acanthosepion pharaonis TaxID=158019 RepID=A0A812BDE8_ACAPH|nr:unnamed protein product [Sepia pharaonis]
MATVSIQVPSHDCGSPNIARHRRVVQTILAMYGGLLHCQGNTHEDKVLLILLTAGEEGLRRYNSWSMTDDDRKDPQKIFSAFMEQLELATNQHVCRLKLSKYQQKPTETMDIFVNRCRLFAKKCDFTANEVNKCLVELLIASTPIPELQKELLNKPKGYKIEEAVKLACSHEALAVYVSKLHQLQGSPQIATINRGTHQRQGSDRKYRQVCKNCGHSHRFGKNTALPRMTHATHVAKYATGLQSASQGNTRPRVDKGNPGLTVVTS